MTSRRRSPITRSVPVLWVGVLCLSHSAAWGEIAQNPQAAEDAKYSCDTSGSASAQLERARLYLAMEFDKNKLACAADLFSAAAHGSPTDSKLLVEAMGAVDTYIEQVSLERDVDPVGIQTAEWNTRLDHAKSQIDAIGSLADAAVPKDPSVATLRAKADLLLHRDDDPKDWVMAARRSMQLLNGVVEASPNVLNGAPLVLLGKVNLDLQPLFGGDPQKAVALLERAKSVDPHDSKRLSYLAMAYAQVDREADVKSTLHELLAIEPTPSSSQALADSTIVGLGLAARLKAPDLQKAFQDKRRALFAKNPKLRPHVFVAVDGHGGENPMTGERQY